MTKVERRKSEAGLQALLAASDATAIAAAVLAAYALRFHSPLVSLLPVTKGVPELRLYLQAAAVLVIAWIPTFAALGLYRPRFRLDLSTQIRRTTPGTAVGILIALGLAFFYRGATYSRLVLVLGLPLLAVLIPAGRALVGHLAARFRPATGIAVVGSGETARRLAARLKAAPEPGTRFAGRFGDDRGDDIGDVIGDDIGDGSRDGAGDDRPAGPLAAVVEAARTGVASRIVLALDLAESLRARELVQALVPLPVEIEWVPDLAGLGAGRARGDELAGLPAVALGEFPLLGWNGALKRAMDVTLSLAGLVLLAPLFAVLAAAVRVSGPGGVIYGQERIGRDGRRFEILKFRTMVAGAEAETGPVAAGRRDRRVTPVGRVLRRTSLDELPQLVNVLRGEMSLVGPRPERPCFAGELERAIPVYLDRQRVKSGMTGWAQIHGLRGGESSIAERVRFDLHYIENWSLGLDCRILARTLATLHRQRNAY